METHSNRGQVSLEALSMVILILLLMIGLNERLTQTKKRMQPHYFSKEIKNEKFQSNGGSHQKLQN